jgi:WD40 repeat protein
VCGCLQWQDDVVVSWAADGMLKFWRRPEATHEFTVGGHSAGITGCDVRADAVVSAGRDCTVRLWSRGDQQSRLIVVHDVAVLGVRFVADAVVSWDAADLWPVAQ